MTKPQISRSAAARGALLGLILVTLAAGGAPARGKEPAEKPAEPASEDAKPIRLSRLQGTAYLGRNEDVVGATVIVRPEAESMKIFVTSSDSKGRFQVDDLPDGEYRVEVRRDGFETMHKDDVALKFPFRAVVEFPMRPAENRNPAASGYSPENAVEAGSVTLKGMVVERGGGSIADITLRLVRVDGQVDPYTLKTGSDGAFDIGDFTAGEWELVATGVGFLPLRTGLDFAEDTILTLSMVRQPADYLPSPLELMPPERLVPPAGF